MTAAAEPGDDPFLQAFLGSLRGTVDTYLTTGREDFDLQSLVLMRTESRGAALEALLKMPIADVRVPRALAVLPTPEAESALWDRVSPPYPDDVRVEAAAQRYVRSDRGRSVDVLREILESSDSPKAVGVAAATVREDPPASLWPALRARLDDADRNVRLNCAWALRSALPLSRDRQGPRCDLLEGRLGSELSTVRQSALSQYDRLVQDLQAGRPVDRWMEPSPPESPAFQAFLETLRAPGGPAYDRAALGALAGVERDRAEHMLLAAVLRRDARAPAALAFLGDFRAELLEARRRAHPAMTAAIDAVLNG